MRHVNYVVMRYFPYLVVFDVSNFEGNKRKRRDVALILGLCPAVFYCCSCQSCYGLHF